MTYEAFASSWPEREGDEEMGEFADKLNNMPKHVVSTTLKDPEWKNTRVISENVPEEVEKLKGQYAPALQRKAAALEQYRGR